MYILSFGRRATLLIPRPLLGARPSGPPLALTVILLPPAAALFAPSFASFATATVLGAPSAAAAATATLLVATASALATGPRTGLGRPLLHLEVCTVQRGPFVRSLREWSCGCGEDAAGAGS